jgi:hypothetical protein
MPTDYIVALLTAERDKLSRAIEALQGARRRGRPPKNPLALMDSTTAPAPTPNGRKSGMTAAARKAQSKRMKAYWAKKREKRKKG